MQAITPCLWFDTQGEEAAELYTSVFRTRRSSRSRATAPPAPGPRARP